MYFDRQKPSLLSTRQPTVHSPPFSQTLKWRFNVNANLMNYSIPKQTRATGARNGNCPSVSTTKQRTIQKGHKRTRRRQLETELELLSLRSVQLGRTHRRLQVNTDKCVHHRVQALRQTVQMLETDNTNLHRGAQLLQYDVEEKTRQLQSAKEEQFRKMTSFGPEYEFLVQMVNLLQHQLSGRTTCDEKGCCFQLQPGSAAPLEPIGIHICRPEIHSADSGSYTQQLESKITRFSNRADLLTSQRDKLKQQLAGKEEDIDVLQKELNIKHTIVETLHNDLYAMQRQLNSLDKHRRSRDSISSMSSYSSQGSDLVQTPRWSVDIIRNVLMDKDSPPLPSYSDHNQYHDTKTCSDHEDNTCEICAALPEQKGAMPCNFEQFDTVAPGINFHLYPVVPIVITAMLFGLFTYLEIYHPGVTPLFFLPLLFGVLRSDTAQNSRLKCTV